LDPKNDEYGTIFTAKRINNQWDSVTQIIEPITLGFERCPRILVDNKTLVFSSIRDKQSSFSLYVSKNLYDDAWLLPKPIGKFSKDNDLYSSYDNIDNLIYFSSSKNKREAQLSFSVAPNEIKPEKFIIVSGKIEDQNNNPIYGEITLHDPISLDIVSKYSNNLSQSKYMFFLPTKTSYIIDFTAPNHSHSIFYLSDTIKNTKQLTINAKLFNKVELTLKTFDNLVFEPLEAKITIKDSSLQNLEISADRINKGLYKITFPIGNKYNIYLENEYSQPETLLFDLTGSILYNKIEKNIEFNTSKIQTIVNISDAANGKPIECSVILTNTSTQQQITFNATTDSKGNITITGRKGDTYNIAISPKGYSFFSLDLTLNDTVAKVTQVKLEPLLQNTVINLKNINFETNSAELTKDAFPELKKVLDLLKNNPNIKIEISAHTDDKGSDAYNNLLSERRQNQLLII
jgi:outer membrane protein OmpA-like peptidoglycan-associated protein